MHDWFELFSYQLGPPFSEVLFLVDTSLNSKIDSYNSHWDLFYLLFIVSNEQIAGVWWIFPFVAHIPSKAVLFEVIEHIVNIADTHIHSNDASSEPAITNTGWSLQVLFEIPLEINFWSILLFTDLTSKGQRLVIFLLVESEKMWNNLGAIKRKLLRGKDELHILLRVWVWQERLEILLHQLLIKAHIMVPFGRED